MSGRCTCSRAAKAARVQSHRGYGACEKYTCAEIDTPTGFFHAIFHATRLEIRMRNSVKGMYSAFLINQNGARSRRRGEVNHNRAAYICVYINNTKCDMKHQAHTLACNICVVGDSPARVVLGDFHSHHKLHIPLKMRVSPLFRYEIKNKRDARMTGFSRLFFQRELCAVTSKRTTYYYLFTSWHVYIRIPMQMYLYNVPAYGYANDQRI